MKSTSESEPVDWLGLARLGSPDTTPRDTEEDKSPPPAAAKKTPEILPVKQDDYLGFTDEPSPAKVTSQKSTEVKAEANGNGGEDDWLKKLQAKKEQRRRTLDDEQTPAKPAAPSSSDDWLGLKSDAPADDWLGGGGEVDVDSILRLETHVECINLFNFLF